MNEVLKNTLIEASTRNIENIDGEELQTFFNTKSLDELECLRKAKVSKSKDSSDKSFRMNHNFSYKRSYLYEDNSRRLMSEAIVIATFLRESGYIRNR